MARPDLIIIIDGMQFPVDGNYVDHEKKFKKDHGYITNDGYVYIYGGKLKDEANAGYFYKSHKEPETYKFIAPSEDAKEEFSVDNVINPLDSKRAITDPTVLKEFDTNMIDTTELKIFAPPVKPNDDVLKRIIKLALQEKQVDLKSYRHLFDKDYHLSNLKSTLTKDAPLSAKYFVRWCEILGLSVSIIAQDNGNDTISPMSKVIECDYS